MTLIISSLNSGSNGNCYYVGNTTDAVLIDAGLSCREIDKRILRSGLNMDKVRAIFISHEHVDHIRGVETLSRKYNLPVYINEKTYENGRIKLKDELMNSFFDGESLKIRSLNIFPFVKSHDAADPYSFSVEYDGVRVGVFTDIGTVCERLIVHFGQCHAAFLEANYDEDMLENGPYPHYLKSRISGEKGHLSNTQALELFTRYRSPQLSHLFLAHLSRENNAPDLVQKLFEANASGVSIMVASRHEESPVFIISKNGPEKVLTATGQLTLGI